MSALCIDAIRIDGGTQPRTALNESVVAEYADVIRFNGELPAVTVYFDGSDNWLADGFHRYHALRAVGAMEIDADVRSGTKRDAILHSVGANASHGLRRTNEDKRRAVQTLLDDAEWATWSDNHIAKLCGVSHPFVGELRKAILKPLQDSASQATRTVTRNGVTYAQKTANIGNTVAHQVKPDLKPTDSVDDGDTPDFGMPAALGPGASESVEGGESEDQLTVDELLDIERAEVARLSEQVARLLARVDQLEGGSSAAQLLALERDRDGYRSSSADHFNKWAAANKKVIGYEKLLDKMRKIAGVEKYGDLVMRITPAPRS